MFLLLFSGGFLCLYVNAKTQAGSALSQDQLPVTTSEVYNAVADFWNPWLTDEAINTFRKGKIYQ